MAFSKAELEAAGLTDFRVFLRQVWDFLRLENPTDVQNDIAHVLQYGSDKQIISAFRGVGKSWITVAFVLWNLLLDPQIKVLVVSANGDLAADFTKFCKQLIAGMPLLNHLAPRVDQRNSSISFDVGPARASKDPSVKSAGITGQITGNRADIIVVDDIEVPKNSYTHLLRERLAKLVTEFAAILKPLPTSRVVYLGTPQNEQSIYNTLANDRGYTMTVWPAEIPEDPARYKGRLARFVTRMIENGAKPGDPVERVRFPRAILDDKRLEYGRTGYALQFMLDTSPSDADRYPLKLHDALVTDVDDKLGWVKLVWDRDRSNGINDLPVGGQEGDYYVRPAYRSPEMAEFTGTIMSIDPSGQGKDETAYAIIRVLHGTLYLIASGGFKNGYSEATLKELGALAVRYRVNKIIVEKNFGGGMFTQLLKGVLLKIPVDKDGKPLATRPLHNCDVEEVNHTGQKEARILDTLEPLMNAHRLVISRSVIEADAKVQADTPNYSLIYQMTRLARVKGALPNDDRIEALAMACAEFVDRLGRDGDKAQRDHRTEAFNREMEAFMAATVKVTGQSLTVRNRKAASKRRW